MTDHELCMAAAKAAGYTVEGEGKLILRTYSTGLTAMWCPRTFSAHAFDLMVDCGIEIVPTGKDIVAIAPTKNGMLVESEPHGTDKHAATMRVIVRAAAAMGGEG